jgi:hypothetical protein
MCEEFGRMLDVRLGASRIVGLAARFAEVGTQRMTAGKPSKLLTITLGGRLGRQSQQSCTT